MSHTNSTPNYNLPQFITTDKPFWLTDVNTAYSDIDLAIKNASDTATTASSNASQALLDAGAASSAASAADSKATGAIASIADTFDSTATYVIDSVVIYNSLLYICTTPVITPGPWTGSTNWDRITVEDILDLKQNRTDNALNTANKTITGAINELKGDKQDANYLNLNHTVADGTSLTNAINYFISTYGKRTLAGGFIITGYGFCTFQIAFAEANQGGGWIVCNNKGTGGDKPQIYCVQYTNGTVTLGFPWTDPN